ncbi:MAG: sulfotransferase [Candidatus Omnitrophica bacterium]|nr:sulfotransferase [Candidatus Omnitrophota bacterium]
MSEIQYVFVCGCPRSGTTALLEVLLSDSTVVLGCERYGGYLGRKVLTRDLYEPERFFDIRKGDSFYSDFSELPDWYKSISRERYEEGVFRGDKIPKLYEHLDGLFVNFPKAKIVFMLRNIFDVASSYEARANNKEDKTWPREIRTAAAIRDWHRSLETLNKYMDDDRVFPVIYEDFFLGKNGIGSLCHFLGITLSDAVRSAYNAVITESHRLEIRGKSLRLPIDIAQKICETAPCGMYRDILRKIRIKQARG